MKDLGRTLLLAIVVGLIVGVSLALVGHALDLPIAVTGGVAAAVTVAVVLSIRRNRQAA